jgi:hypothetical protein
MRVGERIKSLLIHKVDFGKRRKREKNKGCVTHCGLAIFTLNVIFKRQKKNYGNSNISPCKNIIFKK